MPSLVNNNAIGKLVEVFVCTTAINLIVDSTVEAFRSNNEGDKLLFLKNVAKTILFAVDTISVTEDVDANPPAVNEKDENKRIELLTNAVGSGAVLTVAYGVYLICSSCDKTIKIT